MGGLTSGKYFSTVSTAHPHVSFKPYLTIHKVQDPGASALKNVRNPPLLLIVSSRDPFPGRLHIMQYSYLDQGFDHDTQAYEVIRLRKGEENKESRQKKGQVKWCI